MQLKLSNGNVYKGKSFGANANVKGEVIFNTGMSGYVETLTDPSYRGQILLLTYPLQGNYGVPDKFFESQQIQVQGLIVSHYYNQPSHFCQKQSFGDWLKSQNIPALCDVDTRSITRLLREHGTLPGKLVYEPEIDDALIRSTDMKQVLDVVVDNFPVRYGQGQTNILVIDTGGKANIIRSLVNRDVTAISVPWNQDWEKYISEVDGIFLTNGPGNPMDAFGLVDRVRNILESGLPIFGICFGNQLLALAGGGTVSRLKYGHRSVNQPVQDLFSKKCYITSQNHGYVVENETLGKEWEPWFINLNDGTNEGIRHKTKPICSVQFHPEASPGPCDTSYLFDDFVAQVNQHKKNKKASYYIDQIKHTFQNLPARC